MSSNDWKIKVLGGLIEINKNSLSRNNTYNEIEYYDTSSVTQNNFANPTVLKIEDAPSRAKRLVKDKDIIYSTVRPIQRHFGILRNPKPNTVVSTGFAVITCKEIEPYFLYYYLSQNQIVELLNTIAEGSTTTFPAFNPSIFDTFEILCPDIDTQQKIAEILSTIDEKIENNLAANQTLEEIARTLFKEWFVNFNYPNADGNLKQSEFGEIPESWEVGKFGDLADQIKSSVNPSQFPEKVFNHYSLPAFDTNELPNLDLGSSILSNKTGVKKYSVLFSKLNPRIPRIWSIGDIDESNSICSTEFIGFTPKQDFFYSYINHFLKQPELVTKLTGIAMGTSNSHQRIKPADLLELEVIIPDEEVVKKYEKIVRPLLETKFHKIQENENLKITRDSLLPKLMSGEIKINS